MAVVIIILLLTILLLVAGCDSDSDCLNGEDEANCTYHCDSDKYMCDNNTCIPNSWKCDGHFDCNDHTDEVNCGESFGLL